MPSPPFASTYSRTTSGMACHHRLWAPHTVERRRAWHAIIAFGPHARLNDVGRGMSSSPLDNTHNRQRWAWHTIIAFGEHRGSNDVERCLPSSPLGSTHGRMTWGVAWHHRPCKTQTVSNVKRGMMTSLLLDRPHGRQRRAWHDITALRQHTQSATSSVA